MSSALFLALSTMVLCCFLFYQVLQPPSRLTTQVLFDLVEISLLSDFQMLEIGSKFISHPFHRIIFSCLLSYIYLYKLI